jgi:hypothetical protein
MTSSMKHALAAGVLTLAATAGRATPPSEPAREDPTPVVRQLSSLTDDVVADDDPDSGDTETDGDDDDDS